MSIAEVAGVPLASFEEPIHVALAAYEQRAQGGIRFDKDVAGHLELTPDKPNSARSTSTVYHLGKAAELVVIAFAPKDGTGSEADFSLTDITEFADYAQDSGSIPRSKQAMHSEVHLTIAAAPLDEPNQDPILFAGSLDLVGLDVQAQKLQRLGFLGQHPGDFMTALMFRPELVPLATSTTGYKRGERFGDPHAVSNVRLLRAVQVAAFIGITPEKAAKHYDVISLLGADIVHSKPPEKA